ncbi:hypothetical protein N7453_003103 [Penicillium expansum]|nr:hypothetical protein N7453_003103 [Penicillium expansum]
MVLQKAAPRGQGRDAGLYHYINQIGEPHATSSSTAYSEIDNIADGSLIRRVNSSRRVDIQT